MKKLILITLMLTSSYAFGFSSGFKSSECQTMNWEEKGKADGEQGRKIDLLYSYIKKCDKVGAPFSADLYRKGREEGLYVYCSNQNGYELGLNKKRVQKDICPFNMFPEFQAYYDKGRNYKKLEKQKTVLDKKITRLSKTIAILEDTKAQREKVQAQMDELEFKPEMLKTQINKSVLMESMSEPISADPGLKTSVNSDGPIDLEKFPGDMKDDREPASVEEESDESSAN